MPLVTLASDEIAPLREAMLDAQIAVAGYYAETSRGGDTGVPLRRFLSAAQRLNDLFANRTRDRASFKALFGELRQPGAEIVEGVKYVRNVHEHVLSIVRPSGDKALAGGPTIGYRSYEKWAPVSAEDHNHLRPQTRALKASFDAGLCDQPVVATMLDLLSFYRAVNAEIVHRDDRGEWTGFPLMDQPAVPDRLHPEEPVTVLEARAWLEDRAPNGDRVVCGQVTFEGTPFLCGLTFTGRQAFSPFAETVGQVERDVARQAVYLVGDAWGNVDEAQVQGAQGPVMVSRSDLSAWASTLTELEREADWCLQDGPARGTEFWLHVLRPEQTLWPEAAYALRRARRLNACVPPRL